MKNKMIMGLVALGLTVVIGATGVVAYAANSNENDSSNDNFYLAGTFDGKNYIYTDDGGKTWMSQKEYDAANPDAAQNIEFWELDEFEAWMKAERAANQKLADSGDISFYEKNEQGDYVCRAWTQKDVDTLYAQWQEQLTRMKQGYRVTKPITGDTLVGEFGPENTSTALTNASNK